MNKKTNYLVAGWLVVLLLSFFVDKNVSAFMSRTNFSAFGYLMSWFSHYAYLFFILLTLTSLLMWHGKKARWIKPLWLSFFATLIITYAIKFIVARARPDELIQLILVTTLVDYSFPSFHAASAFAPVAVLGREFPKLKWFWLGFAVITSFSRLYFGAHYLSDVVAGAFVGYLTGNFVASRMKKRKNKKRAK